MNKQSLIPEEYVSARLEIRRTIVGVVLFIVVMVGVVGAFFVTNNQWDTVRVRQAEVRVAYDDVSAKIARMEELRVARDDLVHRAELASALLSRVPRSALLAGLVLRMPARVSWTSVEMTSREITPVVARPDPRSDRLTPRGPTAAPVRTHGPGAQVDEQERLDPKHYRTTVVIRGFAPDEVDVSSYVAALHGFELVRNVTPDSTDLVDVDDVPMRRFSITMELNPNAPVTAQADPDTLVQATDDEGVH